MKVMRILSLFLISLTAVSLTVLPCLAEPEALNNDTSSGTSSDSGCQHNWVDNAPDADGNPIAGKHCSLCLADMCITLGHTDKTPATCQNKAFCEVCQQEYGEIGEHSYKTPSNCGDDAVCDICQTVVVEGGGHDWNPATCLSPKTCKVCSATSGDPLFHRWSEGKIVKEPTPTTYGSIRYVCQDCMITAVKNLYYTSEDDGANHTGTVIIVITAVIVVCVVALAVYFIFIRRRRAK